MDTVVESNRGCTWAMPASEYRCSPLPHALVHHMCIPWRRLGVAIWVMTLLVMIHTGHWLGVARDRDRQTAISPADRGWFTVVTAALASVEPSTPTPYGGTAEDLVGACGVSSPYVVVTTGTVAH